MTTATVNTIFLPIRAFHHSLLILKKAAQVAKEAGVRTLVLTHYSPRYDDLAPILADAKAVFEDTVAAEDFLQLEVPYPE